MMTHSLEFYDDLTILNNDLTNHKFEGVTLLSRVKNEAYFMGPFLSHYRSLGVKRFVFIDDNSNDGTREFLFEQSDCMVLGSSYTYCGDYPIANTALKDFKIKGTKNIWLNLLLRKFSINNWAIYADADEFLRLPDNVCIDDIVMLLEKSGSNAAWTVMLDVYPRSISDLTEMCNDEALDRNKEWFFDGVKHFELNARSDPKLIYGGSRARLMQKFRVGRLMKPYFRSKVRRLKGKVPKYNSLIKTMLVKIPEDGYFKDPHFPLFTINTDILLPFEHYKFCGNIFERSRYAIASGVYAAGSFQYANIFELLSKMERKGDSFICKFSQSTRNFQNYVDSDNVQGLL